MGATKTMVLAALTVLFVIGFVTPVFAGDLTCKKYVCRSGSTMTPSGMCVKTTYEFGNCDDGYAISKNGQWCTKAGSSKMRPSCDDRFTFIIKNNKGYCTGQQYSEPVCKGAPVPLF